MPGLVGSLCVIALLFAVEAAPAAAAVKVTMGADLQVTGTQDGETVTLTPGAGGAVTIASPEGVTGDCETCVLAAGATVAVDLGGGEDKLLAGDLTRPLIVDARDGGDRVLTGSGDDLIRLEGTDNDVSAGDGSDFISGGRGTLRGEGGQDTISGDGRLEGGPGDDTLTGIFDATLSGGDGQDSATFTASGPMHISLDGVANDGVLTYQSNVLADVEVLRGGPKDDVLIGDGNAQELDGAGGADRLVGGGGADVYKGGEGVDTADFSRRTDDLVVRVGDLDSVENVLGGSGNDRLVGDGADNALDGGPGDDVLDGGPGDDVLDGGGGADRLHGGDGYDVANYEARTGAVTVDLDGAEGDDGAPGEGDTVGADVEGLWGGAGDDVLTGNAADNSIDGGPGADRIAGGAGNDAVDYSVRTEPVVVDLDGAERDDGAAGEGDTIAADVEDVYGGEGADTLTGNAGPNVLDGGGGADTLDGGAGPDRFDGGAGDDTLQAQDGAPDTGDCGAGNDFARIDGSDALTGCERVEGPPAPPPATSGGESVALVLLPTLQRPVFPDLPPTVAVTVPKRARLGRGVTASVRCSEACTVVSELRVDARTAKRFKLPRRLARATGRLTAPGTVKLTVKASAAVRRKLPKAGVKATLVTTATDATGHASTVSRALTLSR